MIANIKTSLYGAVRFPAPPEVSGSIPKFLGSWILNPERQPNPCLGIFETGHIYIYIYIYVYIYTSVNMKISIYTFTLTQVFSPKQAQLQWSWWRCYRIRFCVLGQNLCVATGLYGLQGPPRDLPWPPVDDGTNDIYLQRFKYDIGTKILMSQYIDHTSLLALNNIKLI